MADADDVFWDQLPTPEEQAAIDAMMAADAFKVANATPSIRNLASTVRRTDHNAISLVLTWMDERRQLAEARKVLSLINLLRSNVVATQSATWSNAFYPLVAILNAAGFEQVDVGEVAKAEHLNAYGGAGGYPGHPKQ